MSLKPIDYAKAVGVAVAVLIVNVLISIVVVLIYAFAIEPGHPSEFYDAAAIRIAPWCSHIAGTALFIGAGYYFARRRPERNGLLFALVFTILYAFIDSAVVGFAGVFSVEFGLSMLAKLTAGQAGARAAAARSSRPPANTGEGTGPHRDS
ncbi:MAG: hypothetical protein O2856_13495 [Planctomycetota bacterium]|nr:hypothetical protein [Planctomycetota bacterium]